MAFLTDLFSTTSILSKKSFVPFSILALALIGNFSWHPLRVVNKGYFFNTPIKFCIKFFFYGNPTDILSFSSILTVPPNTCCINNSCGTISSYINNNSGISISKSGTSICSRRIKQNLLHFASIVEFCQIHKRLGWKGHQGSPLAQTNIENV